MIAQNDSLNAACVAKTANFDSPISFCEKQEEEYILDTNAGYRKEKGQFFTPAAVARFMASLAIDKQEDEIKVLDPGAGAGMLSAAFCELAGLAECYKKINILAYEKDEKLSDRLEKTLSHSKKYLSKTNCDLKYEIKRKDFILDAPHLFEKHCEKYDAAIGNPPYFKIRKNNPQTSLFQNIIYGQPNVYMLFMSLSSKLLKKGGRLVFITPRSYASGSYFRNFRKVFFSEMTPERIHLFNSRKSVFGRYSVLQENIILKAVKGAGTGNVLISSGEELDCVNRSGMICVRSELVIFRRNGNTMMRIPRDKDEEEALKTVDGWSGNLQKYNLRVSTGPVVPFRNSEFLTDGNGNEHAPFLWLDNVNAMKVEWHGCKNYSNGAGRHETIVKNQKTIAKKLVITDSNYVLIRRFSPKEQIRRLIAAPILRGESGSDFIGLENHLNYVRRPYGALDGEEAIGLAAFLNSSILDRYFRILNGNTQVNADEMNNLPLPEHSTIVAVGKKIKERYKEMSAEEIDFIVNEAIGNGKLAIDAVKGGYLLAKN